MINLYASTDVQAVLVALVVSAIWLMYAIDRKQEWEGVRIMSIKVKDWLKLSTVQKLALLTDCIKK